MKKHGIFNADIAAVVASMGHYQTLTVADAGLPIPAAPQRIDLVKHMLSAAVDHAGNPP